MAWALNLRKSCLLNLDGSILLRSGRLLNRRRLDSGPILCLLGEGHIRFEVWWFESLAIGR